MATATETICQVPTNELRLQDVVLTHGMRVLLDREPVKREHNSAAHLRNGEVNRHCCEVYSWVGLVLNPEEAIAAGVPRGWLMQDDGTHRWNVQGNHLARWTVQRG